MKGWQSYQQWLAGRNLQRAELEARFGYDTKHATQAETANRQLTAAAASSALPDEPDFVALNELCVSIIERELQC